ncbi:GNAT family N-acetyltransferase [Geodermatophilus sp. SYSU D00079]
MDGAWQETPTLRGRRVVLVPLTEQHADGWLAAADGDVFTHLTIPRPVTRPDAAAQIAAARAEPDRRPLAQLDPATGAFLGTTSCYDVDEARRALAIGHTWLAAGAQRTGVNREAKLLLLTHAFEHLGAVRVVWHTDERNARSRAAIAALGAAEEGRLRKHRLRRDGTWRTTVQFAMTDDDWPAARARLRASLDGGVAPRP